MILDIRAGDCREIVPQLASQYGKAHVVFGDPPFNIGHAYQEFVDKVSTDRFEQFTTEWLDICYAACSGIFAIHGPDQLADLYLCHARSRGWRRVAWVNWAYNFGQCRDTNWIDARCHLLVYSVEATYTWNPDNVLIESARVRYKDKRVADSNGARVPGTIWGLETDEAGCVVEPLTGEAYFGRVQGTNAERREGHPNQLPIRYLQRIILAYSNPGDLIMDPFVGSGTTPLVANRERRNFVGCDVSQASVQSALDRVSSGFYREMPVVKKRKASATSG